MTKETLFNKFSKNLNLVRPYFKKFKELSNEYSDIVFCPLCGGILTRDYLDAGDHPNALTIEHLPPKSLGGKPRVLLCKTCNSTTGSILDIRLLEHYGFKSFNKGEPGSYIDVKGVISFDDKKVQSRFRIFKEGGKTIFLPVILENHRADRLRNIKGNVSLEIEGLAPSLRYVQIAILKIGYLLAYEKFGHTLLLMGALQNIRDQIANPEKNILPCFGVTKPTELDEGAYAVYEPVDLKGLLVVFEIKDEKLGVFLPPPYLDDKLYYLELMKYSRVGIEVTRLARFVDEDFLHNKNLLWMYYQGINESNMPTVSGT